MFEEREQIGAYLKNIVYNELISKGYNVYIGNVESEKL